MGNNKTVGDDAMEIEYDYVRRKDNQSRKIP